MKREVQRRGAETSLAATSSRTSLAAICPPEHLLLPLGCPCSYASSHPSACRCHPSHPLCLPHPSVSACLLHLSASPLATFCQPHEHLLLQLGCTHMPSSSCCMLLPPLIPSPLPAATPASLGLPHLSLLATFTYPINTSCCH